MNATNDQLCGCSGPGRPAGEESALLRLARMVEMAERREEERKRKEGQNGLVQPREAKP